MTEKAYAKINAYLNVTSRREDGYHTIVSIMQTVSLCDIVSVEFSEGAETRIELSTVGNDEIPNDSRNLAWRAADTFLREIGRCGNVRIRIEKNIPMAAGLAGGSADAAAVLRALYRLCTPTMSVNELCAIGATLGADIPFCIRGGCCLVEGIGEHLTEMPTMPLGALVVARMGEGVSTPSAYGALDRQYGDFCEVASDGRFKKILDAWADGELNGSAEHFFNLFESVITKTHPAVDHLKRVMKECGATRAMMSGSGPSVFGVFPSRIAARIACEKLLQEGAVAFVCAPTEKYPI